MVSVLIFLGLIVAGLALLLFIGGGLMVLIKLGVIGHYALHSEEPAENGDYSLDQSQAAQGD